MTDDREQFQADIEESEGSPLVQPSPEEERNGWTPETLTAYLAEQKAASNIRINPTSALRGNKKPRVANSRYRVFEWQR